jgi:hypothetical protein
MCKDRAEGARQANRNLKRNHEGAPWEQERRENLGSWKDDVGTIKA